MEKEGNWISNFTSSEVEKIKDETNGTIILPAGSTEQHGEHLPVGTDALLAIALADEASERTDVLVAPPLRFGWSPHHLALPGTISIKAETLIEFAWDTIKSLARHGFDNFLFVNGHRIVNVSWMQIAAERCQRKLDVNVHIFDPAYASRSRLEELGFGGVGHADEIETSHMLHCFPELVDMDRAADFEPESSKYYDIDPASRKDSLCYVPSTEESISSHAEVSGGSRGRPTESSAAKGEKYHDHLVSIMVEILESLKKDGALPEQS